MNVSKLKKILIIDDDKGIIACISRLLESDYSVYSTMSGEEGLREVKDIIPDLVLLDLKMPQMEGMEVLRRLSDEIIEVPVIVMTAYGDVQSAVEAMKLGAIDYITKPFNNKKLKSDIDKLLLLRDGPSPLRQTIVGESPQMRKVWGLVNKFGPSNVTILLQGESGTGKELFAKVIHQISKRNSGIFMPVDCAALPENLLESELFGYEKGAFTDAFERKLGKFELANEGTIFLDEIANLSSHAQAKLLRILQEQKVYPLGSNSPEPVDLDVRIIASTNIDLKQAAERGNFRQDLYYRVGTITIDLPPLRDRNGDIELLVYHFLKLYNEKFNKDVSGVSQQVLDIFNSYDWPGNVRELENVIKSAVLLAKRIVELTHLPYYLQKIDYSGHSDAQVSSVIKNGLMRDIKKGLGLKNVIRELTEQAEREIIASLLQEGNLNKTKIAKLLHIDPKTLWSKLKKFKLENKRSLLEEILCDQSLE